MTESPVGEGGETPGDLLRSWRRRRGLTQLVLANRAGVSARHLSYVETGRSLPSRDMIARLCEHLDVPLRARNRILLAAGFAPSYAEHALDSPAMSEIHQAIETMLQAQLPNPAIVIDRGWDLVAANPAADLLLDGAAARLREPPVNVVRLTLSADGLAPLIVNLDEWRDLLLRRLERELELSGDARIAALLEEFGSSAPSPTLSSPTLFSPLVLRTPDGELSFLSTTLVFGTAREITLSELALEVFVPVRGSRGPDHPPGGAW